jgi:hypothetical protein
MSAKSRRVYLVLLQAWAYDWRVQRWHGADVPLKAFSDRAQAEAYRGRCEERERARDEEFGWMSRTDQRGENRVVIVEAQVQLRAGWAQEASDGRP